MIQHYPFVDDTLGELQTAIRQLASTALEMVRLSGLAFSEVGKNLLPRMIDLEHEADSYHDTIRRQCAAFVAATSPLVKDLRFVAGVLQASTDLERIADEALDLARIADRSPCVASLWSQASLAAMAEQARQMTETAVEAFLHGDLALAEKVGKMDDAVDAAYLRLLQPPDDWPGDAEDRDIDRYEEWHTLADTVIAAHSLERIADHATNVAEWAVYLQTGEFVSLNGAMTPPLLMDRETGRPS